MTLFKHQVYNFKVQVKSQIIYFLSSSRSLKQCLELTLFQVTKTQVLISAKI